jgi:hypothetical protein
MNPDVEGIFPLGIEMAMGTQNLTSFYSIRAQVWIKFSIHWSVNGQKPRPIGFGHGFGSIVPRPANLWIFLTRSILANQYILVHNTSYIVIVCWSIGVFCKLVHI